MGFSCGNTDGAQIRVNIAPELAILAQGRPASRPDDFQASQKERSRYDRLVKRQRELAGQGGLPPRKASKRREKLAVAELPLASPELEPPPTPTRRA